MCKSKCCPGDSGSSHWLAVPAVVAAAVLAAAARKAITTAGHVLAVTAHVVVLVLAAAAVLAVLAGLVLLARRTRRALPELRRVRGRAGQPTALRHLPLAVWASIRWRWLTRNLGLAYIDQHRRAKWRSRLIPGSTSAQVVEDRRRRLRYPRARIRPTRHGLTATLRTIPKVGRAEVDAVAEHLADAWHCARVQVTQARPGRLTLVGLRRDPLTEALPMCACPPGLYGPALGAPARPWSLYLGRDTAHADRWADLTDLAGVTVAGLPGKGKSNLLACWLAQLAPLPVQFALLDGKADEFAAWRDRAWLHCGDDLAHAAEVLDQACMVLDDRLGRVTADTGHRNGWRQGPTEDWPLAVTVLDECQSFLDLGAVKGDREAEQLVRRCQASAAKLVRKGRSVMMLTVLATQRPTVDSLPGPIRDNCGLSLAFGLRTQDAAVAALGASIREYGSLSPTLLQDREHVGVTVASLRTGMDPFTWVRTPEADDGLTGPLVTSTAHLRRDITPAIGVPDTIPV